MLQRFSCQLVFTRQSMELFSAYGEFRKRCQLLGIYYFLSKDSKGGRTDRPASETAPSSSLSLSYSTDGWIATVCRSSWQVGSSSSPRDVRPARSPLFWTPRWIDPAIWYTLRSPGGWLGVPSGTATGGCGSRPFPLVEGTSWKYEVSQLRHHPPHLLTEYMN